MGQGISELYITTAELLGSAVRRFMMVCDIMDGKVEEPYFGSGFRCGVEELGRDYERCEEALEMVHGAVTDEWERIENNKARIDELVRFKKEYGRLREAVMRFDDACIRRCDELPGLGVDARLSRAWVLLVDLHDRLFQFSFEYLERVEAELAQSRSPYRGMAELLSCYCSGATDTMFENFLVTHYVPAIKPNWMGNKCAATFFGQYFHLTEQQMNSLFTFKQEGKPAYQLRYSKYPANKLRDTEAIRYILRNY